MDEKDMTELSELQKEADRKAAIKAKRNAGLVKARAARAQRKAKPVISKAEVAAAVESDELTETEIKAIEEQARKEIRLERRTKAKAELKASIKKRLEQEMGVTEGVESVYIDLGGRKHNAGATYVMLDGVRYQQDRMYSVRASVAMYLRELLQNCDNHQCEIEGNPRRYNRERNTRMGPAHENMPASALLRV